MFRPFCEASWVQLMQDQANYRCKNVLQRRYRRARAEGVIEDVLEICMGKDGINRVRCERMRGISGLTGSVGALAGSNAGTAGYYGLGGISIIHDSKARDVVASWIHQARFGARLSRFAQEIGKCLFVTRMMPELCVAPVSTSSVQSIYRPYLLTLILSRTRRSRTSRSVSAAEPN